MMRMSIRRWMLSALALTVSAITLGSCADKVVFNRLDFATPPAAAAGFLGYQEEAAKATICGNCHVGHQQSWERTGHAGAWKTLQASGSAQKVCEQCHTVNQRGNVSPDSSGGWIATNDSRYHDVQCENCHGPGQRHVENPDASQPLAPISVGVNLTLGCGECHNGTHHPFVEEWSTSKHAIVEPTVLNNIKTNPATYTACLSCHSAQGALTAWGVTSDYQEKGKPPAEHNAIVCAVCHDPHSNELTRDSTAAANNPGPIMMPASGGQLRYRADVPDIEQNLCMRCHHKRAEPDIDPVTQSSKGPHSPEGPLLIGEAVGWWFGGLQYDNGTILGTHGTTANPRLCATCHMVRYDVTDNLTGKFVQSVAGHSFLAEPCVDSKGIPNNSDTCPKTTTARSYKGCARSGCHGTEATAAAADTVVFVRIMTLAGQLKALVDQVRASQVKSNDGVWTTAEGADFNYQLAIKEGSHVHNPFLIEALLNVSITEMKKVYGLTTVVPLDLRNIIGTPEFRRQVDSAAANR